MSSFEEICHCRPACLVEASLELAKDEYGNLNVSDYLRHVKQLTNQFASRLTGQEEPKAVLQQLNDYFFGELEFSGNTNNYYDPRNSYLNDVLDRRMGIPITLSVLYQHLAASVGVPLEGINFPGHFLLALEHGPRRIYVDVFQSGQWLRWEDCEKKLRETMGSSYSLSEDDLVPMTQQQILLRSLRNLKGIYSRLCLQKCLQVQTRIVRLSPHDPSELRDLGILYFHAGKPMQAVKTLNAVVDLFPESSEQEFVQGYLKKAAREAVLLN